MREATDFLSKLEEGIGKLKAQLDKLRSTKPIDQMTVEDVYQLHPEFREKIYGSIKNDDWATTESSSTDKNNEHR